MSRTNREATSQRRQRSRPVAPDALADDTTIGQATPPADPRLAHIHQLYEVVADVGAALNIPLARLAEGEALERLEVVARLTVEQFARCDSARVRGWFAALTDDLALDLRLDGQDPDMPAVTASLRAGNDPAGALQTFQAAAQSAAETQGDAISVEARLSVGKAHALALAQDVVAQRPGVAAPAMVAVFYTSAAWNQLISLAAVPYLEQSGLVRADGRTCVLLCDTAGYLAGAALECVGAASPAIPDWLAISPAAFRQFVVREAAVRRLLAEETGWPDAPHILTTEMLRLVAHAPGLETTAARLVALRTELAATALATVVQGTMTDGLTLRFAGVRPATCTLAAPGDSRAPKPTEVRTGGRERRWRGWPTGPHVVARWIRSSSRASAWHASCPLVMRYRWPRWRGRQWARWRRPKRTSSSSFVARRIAISPRAKPRKKPSPIMLRWCARR